MAEGSSDKSTQQGAGDGVMGNLPTARPSRLSRRARGEGEATAARKPAAATRAKPKPASKAGAKPKTAPKPKATAASKPKAAGSAKAEAPGRPRPVRTISPTLDGPARKADAGRGRRADELPPREQNPVELATTVVKAAGELAQIGATVAGQVLKRAAGKLPKP